MVYPVNADIRTYDVTTIKNIEGAVLSKRTLLSNILLFPDQTLQEAGYNRWSPGEPNGGSTENCGVIFQNGLLGNYFCSLPLPFFCEFEPEVVSRSFSFRDEA